MRAPSLKILACCLLGLACCVSCGKPDASRSPQSQTLLDYTSLRADVVKRVQNGALQADASGSAQLPAELAPASTGGKVLIAKESAAGLLILFNAAQGAQGVLYADKPLALRMKLDVGPVPVTIIKKTDDHWYAVICM